MKKYNILFISALSQELKIIKKQVKLLKTNLNISFFSTGIGNYNMILNLTRFLEQNKEKFDFIVNIGVCGYKNNKKDFIQIGRVLNLANEKELIIPNFINLGNISSIACSEKIVFDSKEIFEEEFVDMESYGFEKVCESFDISRILLKIPVDKIGNETKKFDFEKASKFLKDNIDYKQVLEKIDKYLDKFSVKKNILEEKENITKQKILDYYKWTVSEKVILEKEINKFIVLELGDLDIFFNDNNQKDKKSFFKILKNKLEKC